MISALIWLILAVVVIGVLFWAVQQLLGVIPLSEPFVTIVRVLVVLLGVLVVLWVLSHVMGLVGVHVPFGGAW